jgi:hypothetical protein
MNRANLVAAPSRPAGSKTLDSVTFGNVRHGHRLNTRTVLALGLGFVVALACFAAGAGAGRDQGRSVPIIGIADDAPKYADDGGVEMWGKLRELGVREARISVDFDPEQPRRIQEKAFLDRSISKAADHGIDVVFSVYPHVPRALATETDTRVSAFGAYLALLARTYPEVRKYIVLNEPNEGYFFAPQYNGRKNVSAGIAFEALAAGYDQLKRVDRRITVVGLGLSPDGNGKTSTPPVRFIKELGDAYRASGRSKPIMDELGYHIHPRDSRTFDEKTSFRWPNGGPADLNRIKQAVWDAFRGTAQRTFAEGGADAAGEPLRFMLAEVAVQVGVQDSLASRYTNSENVPVADEARQAKAYPALLRYFACDPAVADVFLFLLIDQPDLRRYQSGLLRIDGSKRPAYTSVKNAIPGLDDCATQRSWRHSERVFGARVAFGSKTRLRVFQTVFGVSVTASEDATAKAGLFRVAGPSAPVDRKKLAVALNRAGRTGGPLLYDTARVKARFLPRLEVRGTLKPGYYRWVVRVRSALNTGRTSLLVGPVFRVAG